MPKAIKKKVKKKTVGTEAEVKDRFSDLIDTFKKRQKSIFIYSAGALSVILVIAAILFYQYYSEVKSRQLEYEAYKIYYNEFQKDTLTTQERFEKALDIFKQSYSKSKSPRRLLYIASSYYELGRYDEALASLDEFIKRYAEEKDILPLVSQNMAMIHIRKGNKQEALRVLDDLYNSGTNIFKDYALIKSARILEMDGKKEEATAKYKELTEKFPQSPYFEEANIKLGENKES